MSDTWTFAVLRNNTTADPKKYPFEVFAVSLSDETVVHGYGDSELEARQDCYIKIEQLRKAVKA